MLSTERLTVLQFLNMAKELPDANSPPGVFQMFNENRTFYFESDISSLPHLPCTLPASTVQASVPKLHKSLSQPQLNLKAIESAGAAASSQPCTSNIRIPAAILASTTFQAPSSLSTKREGIGEDSSQQSRYQTEPAFDSSILKSFRQELKLFGGDIRKKSFSAPNSPRRASMPELTLPPPGQLQLHAEPETRKLSLVKEEPEKERQAVVSHNVSETKEMKPLSNPASLMSSIPKEPIGGELVKETKPSLTKKMMTWFVTPQTQTGNTSRAGKAEFNAMSPTSF